ncbi:hypothetical protein LguiB_025715 [Lonicera macranthoides]
MGSSVDSTGEEKKLVVYNPVKMTFRNLPTCGLTDWWEPIIYVETLVSPNGFGRALYIYCWYSGSCSPADLHATHLLLIINICTRSSNFPLHNDIGSLSEGVIVTPNVLKGVRPVSGVLSERGEVQVSMPIEA